MFAREYELVFVVRPDVADEDLEVIKDRTTRIIEEREGKMLDVEDWGKRRLAYDIRKYSKGHYFLFRYLGGTDAVNEIERTFRIDDSVLRFLHIKEDDRVDVETRVAEFAARRAAAEAAAPVEAASGAAAG
jgi:small subunit ribosomal protein S6